MKIAFFWTPFFSAEILKEVLKIEDINVELVVSQADKPVWRKREIMPTATKLVALENNIRVLQPEKLRWNEDFFNELRELDLDYIIVVAYWKIIPTEVLEAPKYGCINIHGSILPKYRWASPVQESLKNGDDETGLTIMYMNEKMDEWDILQIWKIPVDIKDKQVDIFNKFINIWPDLLADTLRKIQSGQLEWQKQNDNEATYCTLIKKEEWEIDFSDSARNIYNKFRAFTPWPGIYSYYNGKKFTIEECFFDESNFVDEWFEVWDVVEFNVWHDFDEKTSTIWVVCGNWVLTLSQVKLEWKKTADIKSFVNGYKEFLDYNFKENA